MVWQFSALCQTAAAGVGVGVWTLFRHLILPVSLTPLNNIFFKEQEVQQGRKFCKIPPPQSCSIKSNTTMATTFLHGKQNNKHTQHVCTCISHHVYFFRQIKKLSSSVFLMMQPSLESICLPQCLGKLILCPAAEVYSTTVTSSQTAGCVMLHSSGAQHQRLGCGSRHFCGQHDPGIHLTSKDLFIYIDVLHPTVRCSSIRELEA